MENKKAPAFDIISLDQNTTPKVEDYLGENVVLLFFNTGCLSCKTRAIPFAKEIKRVYPDMNILIIHSRFGDFVSSDEEIMAVKEKLAPGLHFYKDNVHATWSAYEGGGTPHWTIIGKDGSVLKNIFGSMPNSLQRLELSLREMYQDE